MEEREVIRSVEEDIQKKSEREDKGVQLDPCKVSGCAEREKLSTRLA